ncbi:spherulation-specific family 4 protein [Streptomyces sp. NPDC049837]|uniref:spherulation-specific family 4 protein n=1 Tax=Streptomyces sp. NPDC049837 TaxID=3155277 RepID=UPI003430BB7B
MRLATRAAPASRVAVPAYFDPCCCAADWAQLCAASATHPGRVDLVILNPDSGVGRDTDDGHRTVCRQMRRAGISVAGYISTGYATRRASEVLAEATAYRNWYGLTAIFIDEVTEDRSGWPYYRELVTALRSSGIRQVVINPGTPPDPCYVELADLVVTFEGPWSEYRGWRPPKWSRQWPSSRVCHLVFDTPVSVLGRAVDLTRTRGAGYVYVTDRTLPNPWEALPTYWPALVGVASRV